ncbi:MAG TPA: ThiF family adenylyltransferase [Pyrinomonadaceae bacterium]|nr:ThiF family adenylyltransferase [Pyrinomonadaceae bacterium]
MVNATAHSRAPNALQTGINALRAVAGVEVRGEIEWDQETQKWLLNLRLRPNDLAFSNFVPSETDWYVAIDRLYPFGEIDFFPSEDGGIEHTFQHQSLNRKSKREIYRTGKVCLSDPYAVFGDRFLSEEPFTAPERLAWLARRAIKWLEAASRNQLVPPGEHFELPDFPKSSTDYSLVAFSETADTLSRWSEVPDRKGYFEYSRSPHNRSLIVVKKILKRNHRPVYGAPFGNHINSFSVSKKSGLWILLPSMPVVPPWQAPLTWGDLDESCRRQGVDLRASIEELALTKAGKKRIGNILLIGFPIPNKVGEAPDRIHWAAIQLPELYGGTSKVSGFKSSIRTARWANNYQLQSSNPINWIASENWSSDQINSRGRLPSALLEKKMLIIGGGAIGSIIAEFLVRGALFEFDICDGDDTGAGNLTRHTLDLRHVELNKAKSLAHHLNQLSPWAKVRAIPDNFPKGPNVSLESYDLIVDCTASQKTLFSLAGRSPSSKKIFASFSVSFGAKRLYSFVATDTHFPFEEYRNEIIPWMNTDAAENADVIPPREGVGCWHPVFPARADDIWMWGSIAIKVLLQSLDGSSRAFRVHEYASDGDGYGVHEIISSMSHAK